VQIHLVHESGDHKFAAVGLFVEIGADNPALAPIVAAIPAPGEQPKATTADVDLSKLAPTDPKAYRYNGSLTTPPCTEGITWIVFVTPITLGADQVQALLATTQQPSNRPLQPLNGRRIEQVAAQP
jgi:carbonic anhydrase